MACTVSVYLSSLFFWNIWVCVHIHTYKINNFSVDLSLILLYSLLYYKLLEARTASHLIYCNMWVLNTFFLWFLSMFWLKKCSILFIKGNYLDTDNDFQYVAVRIHTEAKEANSIKHHFDSALAARVLQCSFLGTVRKYQDSILSFIQQIFEYLLWARLLLNVEDTKINKASFSTWRNILEQSHTFVCTHSQMSYYNTKLN